MRRWMLFVTLAAAALPAFAAERVTVAQLQQFLTAQFAAHKSDGSIADHLGKMELSEQLTEPTLDRLTADLKPQKKTAHALQLLADQSAFLDPPAGEIPKKAAPEVAEQLRLVQGAVNFATVTIERLPNFLATRTTRTFDNALVFPGPDALKTVFAESGPLSAKGEYSRQITYREGREVNLDSRSSQGKEDKPADAPPGLTSTGEFGPLLQIILTDSARGHLKWSHWQQMRQGMAAVFKYEVPQEASHYTVDFCCVLTRSQPEAGGEKQTPIGQGMFKNFHGTPGYHGYLYLDAETGAVLRFTLEGDMDSNSPMTRMSVWVEYGAVQIGEGAYLCPVRSMALSELHGAKQSGPAVVLLNAFTLMRLNEVTFTNYHRFGSTARILPATPQP